MHGKHGPPNEDLRSFSRRRIAQAAARLRSLRASLLDIHEQIDHEFGLTARIDYLVLARLRSEALREWQTVQRHDIPVLGCILTVPQLAEMWNVMRLSLGVAKPSQFEDQYWDTRPIDVSLPQSEDPSPFIIRSVVVLESCLTYLDALTSKKPSVFIGSSRRSLSVAHAVKEHLSETCNAVVWNEGLFRIGSLIIDVLEAAAQSFDAGVLVLTPDDRIERDGMLQPAFRDNVLFEAGLFIGALSRQRTFLVVPAGAVQRLPADLQGIVVATYEDAGPTHFDAVRSASIAIAETIAEFQ